ncbi:hypothetical protein [Microvirga guangxiensis]|uniref:Uncharacterized protein n=1 Tax=Microvirga guangxiensis TaxID=549386 RepID=A0A1G5LHD7_9HYPH|nr:hypothetical protein [Microvirga guangxiensis]SCZ12262.1 hypothetical protein SAMN02927923_04320 [Microvirga guangxiensis]
MSTPQSKHAVTEASVSSQIQGRMDAIEDRRVFGWVWDRSRPAERLLVRVLLEGRMISSGTANMARVDLRRNGIGDGSHAFEVDIPEAVANMSANLTVVAVSPSTGEEIVLQAPNHDQRVAEASISAPLNRAMDRLEFLIEAQRRSQLTQREAAETLRATSKQIDEIVGQENGIGAALELVRANQAELSEKISGIEVFHLRFDKVLADFDERIRELTTAADRPMRRAVAMLIAFGGLSAACAIATLVVVLRHGLQ